MSKHTYLTPDEFILIKGLLNNHKHTQREVAFKTNRSDWVVQNVRSCDDFAEYRERFQSKRYPAKKIEYLSTHFNPIDDNSYVRTDVIIMGHYDKIMDELKSINEQLNAIAYILRKELK